MNNPSKKSAEVERAYAKFLWERQEAKSKLTEAQDEYEKKVDAAWAEYVTVFNGGKPK